ncbi:hypothetical protein POM88_034745 [Heracleum sosnowskyi]|uniref:Plastocyanin-like domain-containing protein n=1 Tax=Heracleum sosnowskyi TaxID=360622 RepID=A0AAD8HLR8_9APIA|nr:hypothetical protein POM88_034745 [Heracleum sosnowskyi]
MGFLLDSQISRTSGVVFVFLAFDFSSSVISCRSDNGKWSVVIHWHGITQVGTPGADGTASISQCAINAGETFVYSFRVEKAGTFSCHGHYGMQRSASLYGALIVSEVEQSRGPFNYDGEFTLLLSDWWNQNDHKIEVVEADGNYVEPFLQVDDLDKYYGESYSVLLNTNQCPVSGNHWISIGVRGRKPATPPALAILNYYPLIPFSKHPSSAPPIHPQWNDMQVKIWLNKRSNGLTPEERKELKNKRVFGSFAGKGQNSLLRRPGVKRKRGLRVWV